mmetsp:Transcript_93907/g.223427  ORF Transcript_93907/g.223427 Transcript_93907/m.223427 type:complete len:188 (-) Transcript_93907:57-620(-)
MNPSPGCSSSRLKDQEIKSLEGQIAHSGRVNNKLLQTGDELHFVAKETMEMLNQFKQMRDMPEEIRKAIHQFEEMVNLPATYLGEQELGEIYLDEATQERAQQRRDEKNQQVSNVKMKFMQVFEAYREREDSVPTGSSSSSASAPHEGEPAREPPPQLMGPLRTIDDEKNLWEIFKMAIEDFMKPVC